MSDLQSPSKSIGAHAGRACAPDTPTTNAATANTHRRSAFIPHPRNEAQILFVNFFRLRIHATVRSNRSTGSASPGVRNRPARGVRKRKISGKRRAEMRFVVDER